jgi:hypothetical protein
MFGQARGWFWAPALCSLYVTLGCSSPAEPSSTPSRAALYGSELAPLGEWPSVVPLGEACTGLLVHPRLVVYAAHCGTSFESITVGDVPISVASCSTHVDAPPADSAVIVVSPNEVHPDLAYCVLTEDAQAPVAELLAACEAPLLRGGTPVTLVGYGGDTNAASFGSLRVAAASIVRVDDRHREFSVAASGIGTCEGDSGGPAYVTRDDGTLAVAGVLSGASGPGCVENISFYTDLTKYLSWLEAETGLDVTRCFEYAENSWRVEEGCAEPPICPVPKASDPAGSCSLSARSRPSNSALAWLALVAGATLMRRQRRQRAARDGLL